MIERYTLKEMAEVWTEERKLRTWLDIELAICEAYGRLGVIPQGDLDAILTEYRLLTRVAVDLETLGGLDLH